MFFSRARLIIFKRLRGPAHHSLQPSNHDTASLGQCQSSVRKARTPRKEGVPAHTATATLALSLLFRSARGGRRDSIAKPCLCIRPPFRARPRSEEMHNFMHNTRDAFLPKARLAHRHPLPTLGSGFCASILPPGRRHYAFAGAGGSEKARAVCLLRGADPQPPRLQRRRK